MDELRVLENDTNLILYSHPLDVKIVRGGGNYHDPSLPDSAPTFQYVCVPIDYELPQVEYEILDEIYFIEDDNEETALRSSCKIYTLSQIQNALRNSRSYEDFRYNVKLTKNNPHENERIDQLFNHWANF